MADHDKLEPFLDIEKAVTSWGTHMCQKNCRTRKQKRMFKRQFVNDEMVLETQIDWSHLSVSNKTIWGRITDSEFKKSAEPNQNMAAKPSDAKSTDVNVLFETDFKNDTSRDQEYTMKIEKTTKSSITTEIENGVTKGIELSASLTIGDVLEVGGQFSREVSLNKMEGETQETEVTWGAESTVAVPAGKKASAEMQVIEKQQSGEFTVITTMHGYVIIKYLSMKDGSLVFGHSGKIDTVVKYFVKQKRDEGKKFVGVTYPDDSKAEFQTKGNCAFRYGIKQVVVINQEKV